MIGTKYLRLMSTGLVLTGLFSGCALESKFAGDPDDTKITANVETRLDQHPDLIAANTIYVSTRDHVVYLSGLVDSGLERDKANAIARQASGVEQVVSSIGVEQ
jgi:osmotically-inducible protein OsmY